MLKQTVQQRPKPHFLLGSGDQYSPYPSNGTSPPYLVKYLDFPSNSEMVDVEVTLDVSIT